MSRKSNTSIMVAFSLQHGCFGTCNKSLLSKNSFFPQSMVAKYLHNLANFEFTKKQTKKSFFLTIMHVCVEIGHASSMLNELWVP